MIKNGIQLVIGFFQYIFSRPEYWLVTAHWFKMVLTWMVGYMLLGIVLTVGGVLGISCIDYLFTKDFLYMLLAVLFGGISLFYGLSLLYQAFYNVYYAFVIAFRGKVVDAQITKVTFRGKTVRGNDLSKYNFLIEYSASLEDGKLFEISQGSSIYKSHFYSNLLQEGQILKVKYWKKDPKKAKIMWNKS